MRWLTDPFRGRLRSHLAQRTAPVGAKDDGQASNVHRDDTQVTARASIFREGTRPAYAGFRSGPGRSPGAFMHVYATRSGRMTLRSFMLRTQWHRIESYCCCQIMASAWSSGVALCTCRRTERPWSVFRQICMPAVMVPMMEPGWVVAQTWHCAAVGASVRGQTARIAVSLDVRAPLKKMSAL